MIKHIFLLLLYTYNIKYYLLKIIFYIFKYIYNNNIYTKSTNLNIFLFNIEKILIYLYCTFTILQKYIGPQLLWQVGITIWPYFKPILPKSYMHRKGNNASVISLQESYNI